MSSFDTLPTPDELGEDFLKMQENDDKAYNYFETVIEEYYDQFDDDTITDIIAEYGFPVYGDEDISEDEEFLNAVFSKYKDEGNEDYEDFWQKLLESCGIL